MSLAVLSTETVNAEVLALTLALPRRGMMPAHLELSADAAPVVGEVATLILASEVGDPQTFTGTVRRSKVWAGRCRVVIAWGAGNLRNTLPPRDMIPGVLPVPALLVAQGIALDAGETLAASVAGNLAGISVPRWLRAGSDANGDGGTAIESLDTLVTRIALVAGQPEMTWRILDTGELWIGADAFPDGGDSGNVFDDDADDGAIYCAPPAATLRPGTTINSTLAERVTYRIEGGALRAEVLRTVPGDLSANETPDVYRESHGATVKAQRDDGTIDVMTDDPRVGGLRAVTFRVGLPGCKVTFAIGSRVRVAFADADPSQVFAYAIDQDAAAAYAFALVGDSVLCGWLDVTAPPGGAGGPCAITLSPASGPAPLPTSLMISGTIFGPGHKYAMGFKDT